VPDALTHAERVLLACVIAWARHARQCSVEACAECAALGQRVVLAVDLMESLAVVTGPPDAPA
jgi:hypothetical protein